MYSWERYKEVEELLGNIEVVESEHEKAVSRYELLAGLIKDSDLNESGEILGCLQRKETFQE